MDKYHMQASEEEITDLQKFVAALNREDGLIVVEGKRDFRALCKIGVTCRIVQFHKFGGTNNFVDSIANNPKVIMLLDGDRKGRHLTSKIAEKLERRTRIDLSFKKRLVRITRGKIRFIEQLVCYEHLLK